MKIASLQIPIKLLILDAVGCLCIALGLAEWFGSFGIVPEPLRIRYFEFALIAVGVVLIMPFITHIAFQLKQNSSS